MILYEQNSNKIAYELPDFDDYEEYESLYQRRYEQIQIDSSQVGDMFRWFYERDLSLSLLDREARLDQMEDGPEKEEYARSIDMDCCPPGDIVGRVPTESEAVNTFLEMYIDKMTIGDLAVAMDVLEQLKQEKRIAWWCYVRCGMAISYRLAKATKKEAGWWEVCDRLRKMNKDHHQPVISPGADDKLYASMSISMEDAIDFKREAEELAAKNYVSSEYMYLTLMEQREVYVLEGQADDLLNMLGEDDSLSDYEGYLDHLEV